MQTKIQSLRVNVKNLVRCTKCCIILLPFQLKTKRKNLHCCTYWLTKKRLKHNKYCGTMLGCIPEIWYPSVLQAIVSTVWYSTALKFEIFPSEWRCFSIDIILKQQPVAVDVDRHCYHGVFPYNIFLFLAFSLLCGKFT